MSTYKTTGIVLRRINYAEADRIITFLTPEGKISTIAKGVRRITSKLGAHLELFCLTELMLARGRNLDIVTSARLINSYDGITADYERLRRGFLFLEMIDKLTSDDSAPETYGLLLEAIKDLEEFDPVVAELGFKLKLLKILGYEPNLAQCMESRQEISEHKRYAFSYEHGGVVESGYATPAQLKIGNDHIKLWRLLLDRPVSSVARIKGAAKAAAESLPVCNDFYDYLFGKRFKSSEI